MVNIMSGYHPHDMLDGLLAALGMLAVVLPLIRRKQFQQSKICLAYGAMQFDGSARVPLLIMASDEPGVLVVGLDRRSRGSKNGAEAPHDNYFGVGKVSQNFGH